MSLAIDRFYDELSDLLDLPIYIGNGTEDLEKEVTDNTHGVAVNLSVAGEVDAEDLLHFVDKLKENAREALASSAAEAVCLYLWHEDAQLWYSFVNAVHAKMPFSEDFEAVDSEDEVVNDYLASLKQEEVKGKMFISVINKV